MSRKRYVKRILGILIFLVLFGVILHQANYVLIAKDNLASSVKMFYRQKEDTADVVFLGSSHVYRSISPMAFWEDAGVTAMNVATSSQPFVASYYLMKDVIRKQSPEVIVLEVYSGQYNEDYGANVNLFHSAVDMMPLGQTKLELWWEEIRKDFSLKEQLEFFFPILTYHSRWSEIYLGDLISYSYDMGGATNAIIEPQIPGEPVSDTAEINSQSRKYLEKMIDLCEENQIPLIFFVAPMGGELSSFHEILAKMNTILEIGKERGVTVYHMPEVIEAMDLDYETDFFNSGHLNINGTKKLTKWFEDILIDTYHLQDHRGDSKYSKWAGLLPKYQEVKAEKEMEYELRLSGEWVDVTEEEKEESEEDC